jgi:hypothetical protein
MKFAEKDPGQLAKEYCFIVTMPDPIQPKPPSGVFKN